MAPPKEGKVIRGIAQTVKSPLERGFRGVSWNRDQRLRRSQHQGCVMSIAAGWSVFVDSPGGYEAAG